MESDGIVHLFQVGAGVQRNIGPGEMDPVSVRVSAKGVAGKKFLIKPYRIKSRIAKKGFWADEGVCREKILQGGDGSLASWTDLSSSGESDFLSIRISGC